MTSIGTIQSRRRYFRLRIYMLIKLKNVDHFRLTIEVQIDRSMDYL
jgi:hypothetical protein